MSPIPKLESFPDYPFALLPEGVHPCDEETFRAHFVNPFPASRTRTAIYQGFFHLRAAVLACGIAATQWVDGSFVEGKPDPGDVDVVSFCDYDKLNNLDTESGLRVVQLLGSGEATKATYHTHTFLVASCPIDHPYYTVYENTRRYWRNWFGKTRKIPDSSGPDIPGRPKGFVQMMLGNASSAPVVATERGVP